MKIILFGVGRHLDKIESLLQEDVEVLFYLDNNNEKQGIKNGKKIYTLRKYPDLSCDYVVITAYNYQEIEKQLLHAGCKGERIIPFFKENLSFADYSSIFKPLQSVQYSLEYRFYYRMNKMEEWERLFSGNLIYEMADLFQKTPC